MPVYTCEYTFDGKRHILTSFAESPAKAMVEGFRHNIGKMHKGKAKLDESTLMEFDAPHLANAHIIEFAKTNKLPIPSDDRQAEIARQQYEPLPAAQAATTVDDDDE